VGEQPEILLTLANDYGWRMLTGTREIPTIAGTRHFHETLRPATDRADRLSKSWAGAASTAVSAKGHDISVLSASRAPMPLRPKVGMTRQFQHTGSSSVEDNDERLAEPSSSLERLTGHWSPGAAGYQAWVTRTTDVAGAVMSLHVDPVIRGALGRGLGQTQDGQWQA